MCIGRHLGSSYMSWILESLIRTSQSEANVAFCSFECLAKSLQPTATENASPKKDESKAEVHASAKVDVGEAGYQGQAKVEAHVQVKANASTTAVEVHTSAEASAPSPKKQQADEQVDDDLERLMTFQLDKGQALVCVPPTLHHAEPSAPPAESAEAPAQDNMQQPEDKPATDTACSSQNHEQANKLMELSSLIHNMLRRPGTIDIEEVMAQASTLTEAKEPRPQQPSQPAKPRRITSKQAPPAAANTGPTETKQSQAANTGPTETKQSQAANTGPAETKQSQAANTGPAETEQSQAANTGPTETEQSQAANTGPTETEQSQEAANNIRPTETEQSQAANTGPVQAKPADTSEAAEAGNKRKKSRENETHEERMKREGHNAYMRFYRSIRSLVADSACWANCKCRNANY